MTPLTDDELQRNLSRRVNRQPLSRDDRRELLTSVSAAARGQRRPIYLFGWPFAGVASAAAAVVVLAMVGSLLLPGLARLPGPGGVPEPSPTPSAGIPTQRPDEIALHIYTPSEVSELASDPANHGRVVVVALDPRWPCPGDTSCDEAGFIVVRLEGDAAHVGSVTLLEGAKPWSVPELLENDAGRGLGLVAVDGWLGRSQAQSCPSTLRGAMCVDEAYLFALGTRLASPTDAGSPLVPAGAIRVQRGAYEEFAHRPLVDGDGFWAPRRGVYLGRYSCWSIRAALMCGLEIVARVEPPLAAPLEPEPSPDDAGASQHEIVGAVAEWLAQELPVGKDNLYVFAELSVQGLGTLYGPIVGDPGLLAAGPSLFEGPLSNATKAAVSTGLAPLAVEFVADPAAVREPRRSPGVCAVYRDGRLMVRFGPPRLSAGGNSYYLGLHAGDGCQGVLYVVEVAERSGGYEVIRVDQRGGLIVD